MRHYELVTVLSPMLSQDQATEAWGQIRDFITSRQGEIFQEQPWGTRRLAYPIHRGQHHFLEGNYRLTRFSTETPFNQALETFLRLDERVLRSLVVSLPDDKLLPEPVAATPAATQAPAPAPAEAPAPTAETPEAVAETPAAEGAETPAPAEPALDAEAASVADAAPAAEAEPAPAAVAEEAPAPVAETAETAETTADPAALADAEVEVVAEAAPETVSEAAAEEPAPAAATPAPEDEPAQA